MCGPFKLAAKLSLITLTPIYSWVAFSSARKKPRRTWDRVRKTCACADEIAHIEENKKLEPVSSTSRRGARAAYHDEYPRDFGPRIAYTVS